MGQKDQDQKSIIFFSTFELKYTNLKTGPIKSEKCSALFGLKESIFVNKTWLSKLGGPPGGLGARGPNQ